MEINENVCNDFLEKSEIFSAHLVLKIMRGDFVVGKDGIDHWIELLKDDDLYLIYRFFDDKKDTTKEDIPNKYDIEDICSMLFYIHEKRDGSKEEIKELINELEEKIIKEANFRGLSHKTTE